MMINIANISQDSGFNSDLSKVGEIRENLLTLILKELIRQHAFN